MERSSIMSERSQRLRISINKGDPKRCPLRPEDQCSFSKLTSFNLKEERMIIISSFKYHIVKSIPNMHAYNLYFLHQLLTHYMTNSSQISHNFEVAAYFTHLFIV